MLTKESLSQMTQATCNGRRVTMTMEEKSYLLQVINRERGVLQVRSNSDTSKTYPVRYNDDFQITECGCTGCKEYGRIACAYRLAASRRLTEMKRDYFCEMFAIYA
jgi:hypothetical protein